MGSVTIGVGRRRSGRLVDEERQPPLEVGMQRRVGVVVDARVDNGDGDAGAVDPGVREPGGVASRWHGGGAGAGHRLGDDLRRALVIELHRLVELDEANPHQPGELVAGDGGFDRGPDDGGPGDEAGSRLSGIGPPYALDRAPGALDRRADFVDAARRTDADADRHRPACAAQCRGDPPLRLERTEPRHEVECTDFGHLLGVTDDEQGIGADRFDDLDAVGLDRRDPLRVRRPVELHEMVRPHGAHVTRHPSPCRHALQHVAGLDVDDLVVDPDQVRVRQELDPRPTGGEGVEGVAGAGNDDAAGRDVLNLHRGRVSDGVEIDRRGAAGRSDERLVGHVPSSNARWVSRAKAATSYFLGS